MLAWIFFIAAYFLLGIRDATTSAPLISRRTLAVILAIAALAMLLYDQINIALVTGPVAMLFWIILAAAPVGGSPRHSESPTQEVLGGIAAALFLGGSIAMFLVVAIPNFSSSFPWDPTPYETRYVYAAARQDWPDSSRALNGALARSSRSIELLLKHVKLDIRLGLPAAPDIRHIFELDQSNASLRVMLALPDSDLPHTERIAALQDALKFDAALDPAEAKRLSPETVAAIRSKIAELQSSASNSPSTRP